MPCSVKNNAGLLGELKALVDQVGDGGCPKPCCTQPPAPSCSPASACVPFAQVTMTCPPPILAPTRPEPVEPLRLPCPTNETPPEPTMSADEAERSRYSNFYNNYNIDWHKEQVVKEDCPPCCTSQKQHGQTVDGKTPCCEDYTRKKMKERDQNKAAPGCPTGFKPCEMKLHAPPNCDPCGVWLAEVQPCPPKPKPPKSNLYEPGPCTRPCCKHWQSKEGPCKYDDPCKAHCYNHPPGIKPSGRH